jgi:hypothetical protein
VFNGSYALVFDRFRKEYQEKIGTQKGNDCNEVGDALGVENATRLTMGMAIEPFFVSQN